MDNNTKIFTVLFGKNIYNKFKFSKPEPLTTFMNWLKEKMSLPQIPIKLQGSLRYRENHISG